MTNRKNYNSIVFLTTLSVYLGLVLVGAPPQVLAQTSPISVQQRKIVAETEKDSASLEKAMVELGKLISNDSTPVHLSCNWINSKNAISDLQTLVAEGSPQTISFLRENFIFPNIQFYKPLANLAVREVLQKTKINRSEITFEVRVTFENSNNAKDFSESFEFLLENTRELEAKKEQVISLFDDTKIRHENNQVFVITRLPRGSLDALFAKN